MLVLYLYAEQCNMDNYDDDADTRLLVLTAQLIETHAVARCSINNPISSSTQVSLRLKIYKKRVLGYSEQLNDNEYINIVTTSAACSKHLRLVYGEVTLNFVVTGFHLDRQ